MAGQVPWWYAERRVRVVRGHCFACDDDAELNVYRLRMRLPPLGWLRLRHSPYRRFVVCARCGVRRLGPPF